MEKRIGTQRAAWGQSSSVRQSAVREWVFMTPPLMNAATTDACMEILDGAEMREPVLSSLLDAIQLHLDRRAAGAFRVGAVLFSNQYGPLGQTRTAKELLDEWKNG